MNKLEASSDIPYNALSGRPHQSQQASFTALLSKLIVVCSMRVLSMLTTLWFPREIKFVLRFESTAWGILRILFYKTNRSLECALFCFVSNAGQNY